MSLKFRFLLVFLLLIAPIFLMAQSPGDESPPAELVMLIGMIVTVASQMIKLAAAKLNLKVDRKIVSLVAYVISIVLAVVWLKPTFPVSEDPMALTELLLTSAGTIFGFATLLYNIVLNPLLEKTGLTSQEVMKKASFLHRPMDGG